MKLAEFAVLRRPDCPKCENGWICEQHPERTWPHDDCAGPGMPCDAPGCALWKLPIEERGTEDRARYDEPRNIRHRPWR